MRIGLIDIDCHAKRKMWGATIYPNLALCKISAYHKQQGDDVEWYDLIFGGVYDIVYMSKIFNFSPDYPYPINAKHIIKGGTGYDIEKKLPDEIEYCQPDYSIYPSVPTDISYGLLTRGCPNKCPWCVVPRKEGKIHPYMDIDVVANGNKKIVLMDNNILAAGDYAMEQLNKIIARGYKVDFNQALDARLVTEDNAKLLAQIKWLDRRIRFGCDTPKQIKDCERAMEIINRHGYNGEYFLYCMLTSDFTECYNRLMYWWRRNQDARDNHTRNIYPYSQPYRDPDNPHQIIPQWQKDMANWVNKKMLFQIFSFDDFSPRKGFICKMYKEKYGKL